MNKTTNFLKGFLVIPSLVLFVVSLFWLHDNYPRAGLILVFLLLSLLLGYASMKGSGGDPGKYYE